MGRQKANETNDHEHSLSGEKLSLLAVFARPEDEAFGPSGTLAKYAGEGIRVSLVTAVRELLDGMTARASDSFSVSGGARVPREKSCTCRAAGIHRFCLDEAPGRLTTVPQPMLQERLVRLIREVTPQVIVTYGPNGLSGDSDQRVISQATIEAFELAGNPQVYPQHQAEGLGAYQPRKLYYTVLPNSLLNRWGLTGLHGVPDETVTTVLDVSPYSELKLKAVYCQRHHVIDFTRWLEMSRAREWNVEHFTLAQSQLGRKARHERDLFAGLR